MSPAVAGIHPGQPDPGLRPCRHPRVHHTHGTRTAYVADRCRCRDCTDANANARAERDAYRSRQAQPAAARIEAGPVREHLLGLRATGIGIRQIADLAATTPSYVRRLTAAPTRGQAEPRIGVDLSQRLLRITATEANRAEKSQRPAGPTLALLTDLLTQGWSLTHLAHDLRRSPRSLTTTLHAQHVDEATHRAVRALHTRLHLFAPAQIAATQRLTPAARSPRGLTDATGTRRRLQALLRLGWSVDRLAADLGRTSRRLERTLTCQQVTVATAQRVSDVYQQLSSHPPAEDIRTRRAAADATREWAISAGWLAPLAWDDIDNDPDPGPPGSPGSVAPDATPGTGHPSATPDPDDGLGDLDDIDEVAVERAMAGALTITDLTAAEVDEVVRRLTGRGHSLREIAQQLRTTSRTVSRRRRRTAAARVAA